MVFHLVTDPGTAPDLSGVPDELAPLLTGMLAQSAEDRPSLTEVVQQRRSVIETQGMKIAQARRRLTAHTAEQRHRAVSADSIPTVSWSAPASDTPVTEIIPAELETPRLPDAPATSPTLVEPAPGPADPPAHDSPGVVPADPRDRPGGPRREQPAPVRPPTDSRRPKEGTHTLRHSVQARRTAERLRTAYAAKAPF